MKNIYSLIIQFFYIGLISVLSSNIAFCDVDEEEIINKLPALQGINNSGSEYYISVPPPYYEGGGDLNFIKIFITSAVATDVTVQVESSNYIESKTTVANGVINFDVRPNRGIPYDFNVIKNNFLSRVYKKAGMKISATQPILVYVVVRYAYTSDGFLALPVHSLGNNYTVNNYTNLNFGNILSPGLTHIVAAYDGTVVDVTVGGNSAGNKIIVDDMGEFMAGQTISNITLNEGDVFAIAADGLGDLSGSKISSNYPISVISGHHCAFVPENIRWCDYLVEMELPSDQWGYNYHIPAYKQRKLNALLRIFAKEPNTDIYRDGEFWFTLQEAGGLRNIGWKEMRAWESPQTPKVTTISSDKPIGITYYNTGAEEDNGKAETDPFSMTIYPVEQYENVVTFYTPNINQSSRFRNNYISLIYELNQDGSNPTYMQIASSNDTTWEDLFILYGPDRDDYTTDVNGVRYAHKQISITKDGVYKIKSNLKFAAYSYGTNSYDSYGYPIAGSKSDLTIIDEKPPVPIIIIDEGGDRIVGDVEDETNRDSSTINKNNKIQSEVKVSNLGFIYLDETVSYNYKFSYTPFIAGIDKKTDWTLNVIDTQKDALARILFQDKNGNDTTIVINYKANIATVEDNIISETKLIQSISPNPVTNNTFDLNLNLVDNTYLNINLYDVSGNLVLKILENVLVNQGQFNKSINTNNLANGVYFINVNAISNNKLIINENEKLIIKK